ncbi:MAG: heme lyase CcmF/NrfE family subunit [Alphaproteobacteria bacterium]|nr:heme lyase CcmF/NrfE family subunit [Alphaproteobacteria bacterium]
MATELGHFAFCLSLALSLLMGWAGLKGHHTVAVRASLAVFGLCVLAFMGLEVAYITSDFSVVSVIMNSHSLKPLVYKITGLWGNHEGSMLLWICMLAFFGALIAVMPSLRDEALRDKAMGIQGLISAGFISFSLITSNPFLRTDTPPFDGNSLNPVLQDLGLAFHPPTLYLGYVGFSAVFSLAAGALLVGRVDKHWASAIKPFVAIAWLALSAGIAMGGKWAYYELGWGGWWYWDPVENASLLPWLTGTALLHSLLVLESREALKRWTILLAVATFSLSLLGTFLVRSGVLSSVHAFAVDPLRGTFILGLLALYCGGAFALYAWRAPALKTIRLFTPVSREGGIVMNNLILVTMAATVLTGTLYPLLMDALGLAQISVGAPYYNATVVMMALPLFILMGIGPFLPWKRAGRYAFIKPLAICAVIALAITFASKPMLGVFVAVWLMVSSLAMLRKNITLKSVSMVLGHFGLGLAAIGMMGTMLWKQEDIRVVKPNDTFTVGRHTLEFAGVADVFGPNYGAYEATVKLDGETLHPQKRWYPVSESETTEAAIKLTLLDDVYVVLGERDTKAGPDAWVLRTTVHPFVSTLWAGFACVVLSGLAMLGYSLRGRQKP